MKKHFKVIMCALMAITMLMAGIPFSMLTVHADNSDYISVYRLFNITSGEHLYSADANEITSLMNQNWGNNEGVKWVSPKDGNSDIADYPVYRLYNAKSGEHLFTSDCNEAKTLSKNGWGKNEGVAWFSDKEGTLDVHRVFNSKSGEHLFSADLNEVSALVRSGNWNDEGVVCKAENLSKLLAKEDDASTVDSQDVSIEADVTLTGSGSGYHAKLVIGTNNANIGLFSFGIVHEADLHRNYSYCWNDTAFITENILGNRAVAASPDHIYSYYGGASVGQKYHLKLTWSKADGNVHCYVNDQLVATKQANITGGTFIFQVEGSARRNGDSIDTKIENIKVKTPTGVCHQDINDTWNYGDMDYFGLHARQLKQGIVSNDPGYNTHGKTAYGESVEVSGTASISTAIYPKTGLPYDWDSSFNLPEPRTGETGHPLSAAVHITQND